MTGCLTKTVQDGIAGLARRCGVEKVILFGSRARGTNRERSDIDLAILGGNTAEFIVCVDDDVETLLMFDVVDLGRPVQPELLAEIERDGILIYEKV